MNGEIIIKKVTLKWPQKCHNRTDVARKSEFLKLSPRNHRRRREPAQQTPSATRFLVNCRKIAHEVIPKSHSESETVFMT